METATTLVIESPRKTVSVALRRPLSIGEIWAHFVKRNKRPAIVTLSRGVARVTLRGLTQ